MNNHDTYQFFLQPFGNSFAHIDIPIITDFYELMSV